MKKIFKYALICAIALPVLSSCEGFLEEENFGKPTTDQMLQNEENVTNLVGQAYADLRFMHDHWGYWGVNTLTSDEGLCPIRKGGDWNDGGYWKFLNTHEWNAYGEAFNNIWNCTVSGSVLCNNLLQTLYSNEENMSPEIYAMYVGEMEVLRSYYYYLLFDSFGRIPYMEDYSDRKETLLDPWVTWAHLVACLEKNAPNMAVVDESNRQLYLGRCTQGMAYTLLAKLYLNAESYGCTPENVMAAQRTCTVHNGDSASVLMKEAGITISSTADFYTNAIRCLNKVINSGSYAIENNYFNNFLLENGGSKENIFTIVEDGTTNNERDQYSCKNKLRICYLSLHYKFQTRFGMKLDCWNGFVARPQFMEIYNTSDVRGAGKSEGTMAKNQYAWFLGPLCTENGDTIADNDGTPIVIVPQINALDSANRIDGARMYKYEIDKTGTYTYMENDFVLLRYADVILMKKEAILRGGQDDAPGIENSAVDAIKKRSFTHEQDPIAAFDAAYPDAFTALGTGLKDGILAERGRELTWENQRRRDLIRFGQFENIQYIKNTAETRRWFPIPYTVLQKSYVDPKTGKKIWTQNKGY